MFRVQPLSDKQKRSFNEAVRRINIWCGSVRSGKSYVALLAFLDFCINGPDGLCAIVGRSERTLRQNVIELLTNFCGADIDYKIGYGEIMLYGRKVFVVGASDARAEGRILGATYAGALVDEATLLPENVWRTLLDRLSVKGARLFATTNPDSPYHWLKRDFIDRANELDVAYWDFYLEDNPSLDPIYVKNIKKENTGIWYKRRIEGLWTMAQGAVYPMFDMKRHVIDELPGIANEFFIGVDYGTANPCTFILVGYNATLYPNMWVEKEYYFDGKKEGRQKTDGQYAEDFGRFIEGIPIDTVFIDPSALSFKTELRSRFKNLSIADANNNVLEGIGLHGNLLNEGTLKIHNSCKNLIGEYTSYVWDDSWQKRGVDKPLKMFDHCVTGNTMIWTPFGKKQIKEISSGEKVLSFNGKDFEYQPCTPLNVTRKAQQIFKVTLQNGHSVKCTGDHKFLTKRGYVEVLKLLNDDEVICLNDECSHRLTYSKFESIEERGVEDVYCINVPSNGNFVVNEGVVIKNCQDALRYVIATRFQNGVYPAKRAYQPPEKMWDPMGAFFNGQNRGF